MKDEAADVTGEVAQSSAHLAKVTLHSPLSQGLAALESVPSEHTKLIVCVHCEDSAVYMGDAMLLLPEVVVAEERASVEQGGDAKKQRRRGRGDWTQPEGLLEDLIKRSDLDLPLVVDLTDRVQLQVHLHLLLRDRVLGDFCECSGQAITFFNAGSFG